MVVAMTQPDVGPERRLYAMMQHLMIFAANGRRLEVPAERGVVTRDDALDAVLQVAAVIDEAVQAGRIPAERGVHGVAMLMLVREYVQPLPAVPGPGGGPDKVTPDLAELVKLLRRIGGESGIQG
jgi:hypothetical protein